jgi:hypothetical protein
MLLGALPLEAQVAVAPAPLMSFDGLALSQQAPNTLVLGTATGVSYDSNALSSQPPTSNVQYTVYPQIGLNLARPKWDALISFMPGFSYSGSNLPQYQALSLTSSVTLQYRPTQRLSLNFLNSLVSSTNPFDSLAPGYPAGSGGTAIGTSTVLNYLPRTNEFASADVEYSLDARTSLTALGSYNFISYQYNANLPSAAQPFQQSMSAQLSLGLRRTSSPRYQGTVLYVAQLFDAGQGRTKTVGQSFQYSLQYSPKATLVISAMIGPEYLHNSYTGILGAVADANLVNQRVSAWMWTGTAGLSWTKGRSVLSVNAARFPGLGTQYQGTAAQTSINASIRTQVARKTDLDFFGGYNVSSPVVIAQSISRLSNNYLSTGTMVSKTIERNWTVSLAYWYLMQTNAESVSTLYSGNHNRVAVSLSYCIAKPLRK